MYTVPDFLLGVSAHSMIKHSNQTSRAPETFLANRVSSQISLTNAFDDTTTLLFPAVVSFKIGPIVLDQQLPTPKNHSISTHRTCPQDSRVNPKETRYQYL
jgi:hypothetical protein